MLLQPRKSRWPGRWFVASLALAVVMVPALLYAQEGPGPLESRCAEIHEAIVAENLPLASVRQLSGDRYELVFPAGCSAKDKQAAEAIKVEILATDGTPKVVVTTLEDALVVLRFEPGNESASKIVRARYLELRAQARGQ